MANETSNLMTRLGALRRQVRSTLALYGAGYLLMGLAGGALVLGVADYMVHFNPYLRAFLLLAGVAALIGLAIQKLVMPLRQPLSDSFLASRLETVNASLADDVMSAVHFLRGPTAVNAMAARAVKSTEAEASGVDFRKTIDPLPARRAAGVGALLLVVLIVLALSSPSLFAVGLQRWTSPFGGHDWPRTTTVALDWSQTNNAVPKVWPIGEPLPVRAVVTRGFYPSLRVYLDSGTDTVPSGEDLMTYQKAQSTRDKGVFEKVVDTSSGSTLYVRVAAGDDTDQDSVRINLARRPEIATMTAECFPPDYVRDPVDPTKPGRPAQFDLGLQSARAYAGGTMSVLVKIASSQQNPKKLSVDGAGHPEIRFLDQATDKEMTIPGMTTERVDDVTARVTFPAVKSLQALLLVKDDNGFENHSGGRLSLDVVPDTLPTVIITEPRRQVDIIPTGQIAMVIQANDDLGLTDLVLRADPFDGKPADNPEMPGAKATVPLKWTTLTPASNGDATGRCDTAFDLSTMDLKAGDRLSVYAMVRDNYAVKDATGKLVRHAWVRSSPISVVIQTPEQIKEIVRRQLNTVRDQLRSLLEQQTDTHFKTRAVGQTIEKAGRATPEQKQQLAELTAQQAQEAQRAMAVESQVGEIQATLAQNKMQDDDLGKLAADAREGIKQVGQENMPKAAGELSHAQENAGQKSTEKAQQAAESTTKAGEQQQTAMATMENVISKLGAAGDFQAIQSKLADILSKQEGLNQKTREAAAQSVGLKPEELPEAVKNKLGEVAKNQAQLADQTHDLLKQMERAANDLKKTDPASSESLSKAAEAGNKAQVSPSQSAAAQSAQDNQIASAAQSQATATNGLKQMMAEMDEQNKRKLEELARQLEELTAKVQDLLDRQKAIAGDTVKAGEKATEDVLTPLGDRQGRLQTNTLSVVGEAGALPGGSAITPDLRAASDAMINATAALAGIKQPDAIEPQKSAIASLLAALDKAQAALDKANDDSKDKALDDFIKKYEEVLKGQVAVKATSDLIGKRKASRGELMRPDTVAIKQQAPLQAKLADTVAALNDDPDLKAFDVVTFVNSMILDAMADSKTRLEQADVGEPLASAQQTAVDRITDLLDALKAEKKNKNAFKKPAGGGGGGGGSQKPPLVPKLAELKLLKAMQLSVNKLTIAVDKQLAAVPADQQEAIKQRAERLAEQQEKIQKVAEKVIPRPGQ